MAKVNAGRCERFTERSGSLAPQLQEFNPAFGTHRGGACATVKDGDLAKVAAFAQQSKNVLDAVFRADDLDLPFLNDEHAVTKFILTHNVLPILKNDWREIQWLLDAHVDEIPAKERRHEPVQNNADFFLRGWQVEDHETAPDQPGEHAADRDAFEMGDGLPVTENAGISQTREGVWGERFTLFMTKDVFTDECAYLFSGNAQSNT